MTQNLYQKTCLSIKDKFQKVVKKRIYNSLCDQLKN
jgi:hypothetical protein